MKAFSVSGKFRMGHITSPFTIETIANDVDAAKDRVFATIGSRHRVNRHQIEIATVKEVARDAIKDPVVEKRMSMVK